MHVAGPKTWIEASFFVSPDLYIA